MDLSPNRKAIKNRKRLGRGVGSGTGKTCGRGQKGQKSRSGVSIPALFEGGQNPLHRRVPKRGFFNAFKKHTQAINIAQLAVALAKNSSTTEISDESLQKAGLTKKTDYDWKVLIGREETKKEALASLSGKTWKLKKCSESAKKALEVAGVIFGEEG
ncbi:MAG: 50S ribosomal protein L15 [Leptospirales bacterium]